MYEQIFIDEFLKWTDYTDAPVSQTESVAFGSGVPLTGF